MALGDSGNPAVVHFSNPDNSMLILFNDSGNSALNACEYLPFV